MSEKYWFHLESEEEMKRTKDKLEKVINLLLKKGIVKKEELITEGLESNL